MKTYKLADKVFSRYKGSFKKYVRSKLPVFAPPLPPPPPLHDERTFWMTSKKLSLSYITKLFLNFSKFEPQYFYKL